MSENDYGPAVQYAMQEKHANYFAGHTLVIWDVDVLSEGIIKLYKASAPDAPTIFRRSEIANAETAVPGWQLPVDALFAWWDV